MQIEMNIPPTRVVSIGEIIFLELYSVGKPKSCACPEP